MFHEAAGSFLRLPPLHNSPSFSVHKTNVALLPVFGGTYVIDK